MGAVEQQGYGIQHVPAHDASLLLNEQKPSAKGLPTKRHLCLGSGCQDYSTTKSLNFIACAWNDIQPGRCNGDMGEHCHVTA